MRLTRALCRRRANLQWKLLIERRLNFPDIPPQIPKVLVDKGVEVVDPTQKPPRERWRPPVDDPRFYERAGPEEMGNYNPEAAYVCSPTTALHEGVRQVAGLAKVQVMEGVPPAVNRLLGAASIPNQNLLLQRAIMQAQYWNTTREKMPKRIDPRKPGWKFKAEYGIPHMMQAGILIRNLLRLCQSQVSQFPSLTERRQIYKPHINSHFYYGDKPVVIRGTAEWLITSNAPLPRFADEQTVDASVGYELPDLFPVSPTIDLQQDHHYTLDTSTGVKEGYSHGIPHTVILTDQHFWPSGHRAARNLMFCLGLALAQARRQFGNAATLPEPVCVQCVSLDRETVTSAFLQLNTTAFNTPTGVKNLAWVHTDGHLFRKVLAQPWMPKAIRDERLEDLDPTVFHQLMAVYLNGVPELCG